MGGLRTWLLVAALALGCPALAAAEFQVKPFVGLTFKGNTTLFDLDSAAGHPHFAFGVSAMQLGEVFGLEGDVARVPGFFQSGNLVLGSSVTTVTVNLVVAVPRRVAGYGLRPYAVAGGGLMRAKAQDLFNALPVSDNFRAVDVGGGVTGFVNDRVGLNWDVRWFRSAGGSSVAQGNSFAAPQLSFWRAGMALAIRY